MPLEHAESENLITGILGDNPEDEEEAEEDRPSPEDAAGGACEESPAAAYSSGDADMADRRDDNPEPGAGHEQEEQASGLHGNQAQESDDEDNLDINLGGTPSEGREEEQETAHGTGDARDKAEQGDNVEDDQNCLIRMLSMDGGEFEETPSATPRPSDFGETEMTEGKEDGGDDNDNGKVVDLQDEKPEGVEQEAPAAGEQNGGEGPTQYFVAKALNEMARDKSEDTGTWQIQKDLVEKMQSAFKASQKVILVFCSVTHFCGFARMSGPPGAVDDNIWAGAASGARVSAVEWLCKFNMGFKDDMLNSLDNNQPFSSSTADGQEIDPELGACLCEEMLKGAKEANVKAPKKVDALNPQQDDKRGRDRSVSPSGVQRPRSRSRSPPHILDMNYEEYLKWFWRIKEQKERYGKSKEMGGGGPPLGPPMPSMGGGMGMIGGMGMMGGMGGMGGPMMASMMNPMMGGGMMGGMMNPMMAQMMAANPMMAQMMGGGMGMGMGMGMMGGAMNMGGMGGMIMQTEADYLRACEAQARQTGNSFNPEMVKQYYGQMLQYMQQKQQQMGAGARGGPPPPPSRMMRGRGRGRGRGF